MKYEKQHEIKKLTEQLQIPIGDIEIENNQVELFYKGVSIGHLMVVPVDTGSVTTIKYVTDTPSLNNLNWLFVFQDNELTLTGLVRRQVKDDTITLVPGVFRRFYIKIPGSETRLLYGCSFEKGEWRVFAM